MLTHLHISNFAIVRALEIEWRPGMTAITGETGAGKSISLDALALCLGERADGQVVRPQAEKADLVATFDISLLPQAQQWLTDHDLAMGNECIVRRVISAEGRSRGFINGVQVPAQQLKALGQQLLCIHGQHAHQQLLRADYQREVLDAFSTEPELQQQCRQQWKQYQHLRQTQHKLLAEQQQRQSQRQLLEYQVAELHQFAPQEGEYEALEHEHKKLCHSSTLIEGSELTLQYLYEESSGNAYSLLKHAVHQLQNLADLDNALDVLAQPLAEALITLEETSRELRRYAERVDIDPARLAAIDERLGQWHHLSRKHQILAAELPQLYQQLQHQLHAITQDDEHLAELAQDIEQALHLYQETAQQLTQARISGAQRLANKITDSMAMLSMPHAQFKIEVMPLGIDKASAQGWDQVEFLVCTNLGQPLQAIHKVASGGELSRISLAIQVILAEKITTPTLIFDEVDVGISGPVAAGVGKMLRQLGKNTQLICVTHLPQVASQGHQQMFVEKYTDGQLTETRMRNLTVDERVQEVARLLAGENVSAHAIANARELLKSVEV